MKFFVFACLLILTACGSTPVPKTYVLSAPADPVAGVNAEDSRPVVDVRTVTVPDYLDTLDIFIRDGRNELKPSPTGRWGERLSVGITHALSVSLGRRLPGVLVTQSPASGQSPRDLLVSVDAFDIRADGQCVLTARWTILGENRGPAEVAERGTFVARAPGAAGSVTDATIVSAMTEAVEQLADRVATGLRRGARRPR